MTYEEILILIPSHSLEDFPTDVGDDQAAGLLGAFAVAWHPVLLEKTAAIPAWHRADEPPEVLQNRLVFVPSAAEEWLPGGWSDHARYQGAVVIDGLTERSEMIEAALAPLKTAAADTTADPEEAQTEENDASSESAGTDESEETATPDEPTRDDEQSASDSDEAPPEEPSSEEQAVVVRPPVVPDVDPELVADFLALGTAWLQLELLTRQMHHYSNFDEVHLQREAVSAAQAAVADDADSARAHLRTCFEVLTEARERFYPVDCYLIDLCLLIPRLADDSLARTLSTSTPVNLLVTPEDLQTIKNEKPDLFDLIAGGWERATLDVIGGEFSERPTPLMPLESLLWDFTAGQAACRELCRRLPTTWGRRRFGFSTQMPQILNKFGYDAALHVALDDGIYPDEEQSKIRWEGADGTVIDAVSRIPLAADSAASYLRFPQRMAESMEEDHLACVILARWPEVHAPWFDDFRRIQNYSPTLGRFVTFREFFDQTDDPGRLSSFEARDYLSPFLIQAVARQEPDPISRYAGHLDRRRRFDAAAWYSAVAALLSGREIKETTGKLETQIELAGPDAEPEIIEAAETALKPFETASPAALADVILSGAGAQTGCLILNPLSFRRTAAVTLPGPVSTAEQSDFIKASQPTENGSLLTVSVPPCGFVWVPAGDGPAGSDPAPTTVPPLAEGTMLRNEYFEVHLNEETGGIARIKQYGRSPNRLSQQLAFRFPRERTFLIEEDGQQIEDRSWYSEMRCRSLKITNSGPVLGEIVTTGDILDQTNDALLATFRQTTRIWKGRPIADVEIELDVKTMPEGDPWTNYIAARFAWNDSTASLTRSVQQGAHGFRGERFESLHYFEIAADERRTTIINPSSPFYRKTGMRMADSLLIVAGETRRTFRFSVAVDVDYPLQAALDVLTPFTVVPATAGPPRTGESGWLFHLNAKNVQILQILRPRRPPEEEGEPWEQYDREKYPGGRSFSLRLLETEGRHRSVKLRCFKTPALARQTDCRGRTIADLAIVDDAVNIEMTAHEIADIELIL